MTQHKKVLALMELVVREHFDVPTRAKKQVVIGQVKAFVLERTNHYRLEITGGVKALAGE